MSHFAWWCSNIFPQAILIQKEFLKVREELEVLGIWDSYIQHSAGSIWALLQFQCMFKAYIHFIHRDNPFTHFAQKKLQCPRICWNTEAIFPIRYRSIILFMVSSRLHFLSQLARGHWCFNDLMPIAFLAQSNSNGTTPK